MLASCSLLPDGRADTKGRAIRMYAGLSFHTRVMRCREAHLSRNERPPGLPDCRVLEEHKTCSLMTRQCTICDPHGIYFYSLQHRQHTRWALIAVSCTRLGLTARPSGLGLKTSG